MPKDSSLEDALAALRREFADTLPARLDVLRAALNRLRQGVTPDGLKAFHLPAHALQGTAGSYEAHELVPHAARLSKLARRWIDAGAAPGTELEEAARELDALEKAMERFRRRLVE
ncbi:MAG TPA: Hpt domain-containing protein [Gemmatimonadales bacterium]|jgi:HPt (histidine-containing phosphotransfer) domain-containing protein